MNGLVIHAFAIKTSFTGPYYCAENSRDIAQTLCTKNPQNMSIPHLSAITYTTALSGTIDPPHYMKNDMVYIFSCGSDRVVVPGKLLCDEL